MTWAAITAIVGTVGGLVLGYLGYRRSRKVDAVSEQSGLASDNRAGTAQVIEALNGLLNQLQEDNQSFRDEVRHLTGRLEVCFSDRDALKRELARLHKRYGENGNDTPPHGTPTT